MTKERTFFVVTICAAFLGAFFLLYPFLQYLVFALLLTYMLHPLTRRLQIRIRSRSVKRAQMGHFASDRKAAAG